MQIVNRPEKINGIKVVDDYAEIYSELLKGNEVYHWEEGDSMAPILENMEYCKITPISSIDEVKLGDPVFCKIKAYGGSEYYMVHMVLLISNKASDGEGKWFQIGNTSGDIYGWTQDIYGIARGTDIFQETVAVAERTVGYDPYDV